mgnify:CR=1 FL=1
MEMFKYAFMQRAFIVGILLAAVIPCIGIVVVCKRLSMIGDALSHTSLAGVAIGLILGINPVFTASVTCVLAALGMEGIRRNNHVCRDWAGRGIVWICKKYSKF